MLIFLFLFACSAWEQGCEDGAFDGRLDAFDCIDVLPYEQPVPLETQYRTGYRSCYRSAWAEVDTEECEF